MKISIIVEGRTEKAFVPYLREYLKARLTGNMPRRDVFPYAAEKLYNETNRNNDYIIGKVSK